MESAAKAVNSMNNVTFFGKSLKVFFSKNKSHIIAKADGTYVPPTKATSLKRPADNDNISEDLHPAKQARVEKSDSGTEESAGESTPSKTLLVCNLPEKVTILMVSNLFDQYVLPCCVDTCVYDGVCLCTKLCRTSGYKSARMHDTISNSAFVEFEDISSATEAMKTFQNMSVSGTTLSIEYAK
uniref:U1 small nuclear ribonucleoprotein A n=1 Tax=Lygus hesperus TaxID=30085 RepID=A0A0A9YXZ1_LYGHE